MTDSSAVVRRLAESCSDVTGGIAAYKAAELVRRLRDRGAEVQVVMTQGAERFVTALTFQALSGRAVRTDLWDEASRAAWATSSSPVGRNSCWSRRPAPISWRASRPAGRMICSPTLVLATEAPVWVAPAMNRLMWANAATQANVATLAARGVTFSRPRGWRPGVR